MSEAVSLQQVYDELKKIEINMVTKAEFESLTDSLEILSNPESMKQLVGSSEDIRKGRAKQVTSTKDLLIPSHQSLFL